jgi:two-component system CheB/CheR fusion protein
MNVDFSAYRPGTLKRRIARRMALRHIDSLHEYVRYLEKNSKEAESLYEEILIKVTSFFRDPGTFEALKTHVFGPMLENRSGDDPVRIWVPGCSTGEEAYSIVMALLEYLGKRGSNTEIQMFATDISETSLQKARAGLYLKNIESDISPERLRRFFVNVGDKYQISKAIRELCIFARQNMVRDPPFSRLDLISCRNVMIYLEPMLQRKLWPTFHYALKTGGYLMLGNSETIGSSELFSVVEKPHRIYAKKQAPHVRHMAFMMPEPKRQDATEERADVEPKDQEVLEKLEEEADRLLLKYAPAAVVINQDLDIVQFRGRTGAFLEAATGRASFNLIKMAKEGLLPGLRAAIQEAKTNHAPARREGIRVKHNGGFLDAAVEVVPITKAPHSRERYFMILFEDLSTRQQKSPAAKAGKTGKAAKHDKAEKDGKEAARLRSELAETKEYLQSIIEEQEVTNEELKSANEELLSANEELQSTNEERETAREELQSINEELTTVNEELQTRNLELATVNNDLVNLLKSVNVPILMLGGDLRIRRVTAMAEKVLNLLPTDIGRPITDIQAVASIPKLKDMMLEVLDSITPKEMETQDSEGRWYSIRIRPYRTGDNKIDGVVISFIEITDLKRHAAAMTDARDYAESIVDTVRQPLLVLNHNLIVQRANAAFYNLFRTRAEETEGRRVYELGNGQWDIPRLRTLLEDVLPHHTAMQDVVVEHDFPIIGRRSMVLNARRIESSSSRPELILLGIEDVTGRGS